MVGQLCRREHRPYYGRCRISRAGATCRPFPQQTWVRPQKGFWKFRAAGFHVFKVQLSRVGLHPPALRGKGAKHLGSGLQPGHRLVGSVERTTAGVAKPFVDRQANDSPQIARTDLLEQRNEWRRRLDTSWQSTSRLEQHRVGWAGGEAMKLL